MARYGKTKTRRGSYTSSSTGYERAREHIREAEEFSRELGGTDKDVKQYFFSLSGFELENILTAYGLEYGKDKEGYARDTLPYWRSGGTKMSGLVAKRLFELLPPRMPEGKKYELAENVWRHFGPSSSHSYTIGPNANIRAVAGLVLGKLNEVVTKYDIPTNVQNRFNWLSAGDVRFSEQLLNHFRQMDKELATQKVNAELPVLQRQMREHGNITSRAVSTVQVHKHQVSVYVDKSLDAEIREGAPKFRRDTEAGDDFYRWLWILIVGGIFLWVIFS